MPTLRRSELTWTEIAALDRTRVVRSCRSARSRRTAAPAAGHGRHRRGAGRRSRPRAAGFREGRACPRGSPPSERSGSAAAVRRSVLAHAGPGARRATTSPRSVRRGRRRSGTRRSGAPPSALRVEVAERRRRSPPPCRARPRRAALRGARDRGARWRSPASGSRGRERARRRPRRGAVTVSGAQSRACPRTPPRTAPRCTASAASRSSGEAAARPSRSAAAAAIASAMIAVGRRAAGAARAPRSPPRAGARRARAVERRDLGPRQLRLRGRAARRWSMIVVAEGAASSVITQPDHAHFSGELLSLWRADGLPVHPRREELLFAAREHDNGWREADAAPRWDAARGRPHDFLTLPRARTASRSGSAAPRATPAEPPVRRSAHHPPRPQPLRRAAGRGGLGRASSPSSTTSSRACARRPARRASELAADYRFLDLADLASLAACNGWREPVPSATACRLALRRRRGCGSIPFPSPEPPPSAIPCRRIPRRAYRGRRRSRRRARRRALGGAEGAGDGLGASSARHRQPCAARARSPLALASPAESTTARRPGDRGEQIGEHLAEGLVRGLGEERAAGRSGGSRSLIAVSAGGSSAPRVAVRRAQVGARRSTRCSV